MLSIVTMTYIFKVTKFERWIFRKWWELTKNDIYTGWYLLSNVTIANIVLRGFDLIFQGQIFQMQISLKWLAKHASYGFYRIWYLPLNCAIPKVVLCDVSLLCQGQIFQMLIPRKRCQLHKYIKYDFYTRWYLPSKSIHWENHTLRPCLAISWSKLQIFTMLFQQICLHLHAFRHQVAIIKMVNLCTLLFINYK